MNRVHEQSKRKNKSKEEARTKSSIPLTIVINIKAKTITFHQKRMIAKRREQTIGMKCMVGMSSPIIVVPPTKNKVRFA